MPLGSNVVRSNLGPVADIKGILKSFLTRDTDRHALKPDIWQRSHPESVRVYRQ